MGAMAVTGALVGMLHTLAGPDHYVPFIVMARAGRWSLRRTLSVTAACGLAHVGTSLLLGATGGIAFGWSLARIQGVESASQKLVSWLFIGFGLAYASWGMRRAVRGRVHTHWHRHADGSLHSHEHTHEGEHALVHTVEFAPDLSEHTAANAPWALFVLFVLGPCEPLIPLLMYPAAARSWAGVATVTFSFAATTIGTMLATVLCGVWGLSWSSLGRLARYDHALAGLALAACGIAVQIGL
jgi:nickel/cobalt exporter